MKKILFLCIVVAVFFSFTGCETTENDPAGARNMGVVPLVSNLDPGIFDSKDLVNSYIEFYVALPEGQDAEKIEVIGSYEGNEARIPLMEISSFPATVRIVSGDIISKLGLNAADIVNGDVFTIELLTTTNTGVTTRSNAAFVIPVACAYDPLLTTGSYYAAYDASWGTTGDVTLTADATDKYKIYVTGLATIEGLTEDLGPLVMHIDPVTYALTIDKTALASLCGSYHNFSIAGSGSYNSCDGTFSATVKITVTEGSYGTYTLVLTKNL
jgi:hypothetical protein